MLSYTAQAEVNSSAYILNDLNGSNADRNLCTAAHVVRDSMFGDPPTGDRS